MSAATIVGLVGLVLGLGTLIFLIFKKVNPLLAAIAATFVVALFSWTDAGTWENNPLRLFGHLLSGIGNTFGSYLAIFMLATIYGKLMADTGCANSISNFLLKILGKKSVIVVVVLTTALLVYGGVTAMVVAFTIFPIGVSMFRQANISKKLLPATICLGQCTFALTALPGSPQLNNIIPIEPLGTSSTSAPVLGIIATVLMLGLGLTYILLIARSMRKKGIGFDEESLRPGSVSEMDAKDCPHVALAFLPILILIGFFILFDKVKFGSIKLAQYYSFAPVCLAMLLASVYLVVLSCIRKQKTLMFESLKEGMKSWVMPLLNFAVVVGFGTVIQNTQAYTELVKAVIKMPMHPFVSAALSVTLLAGVTGSASGGIKIALSDSTLVESWTTRLTTQKELDALHRIISVSSCCLDSLPHCGGILATLDVCQETHSSSYLHIFVVTVAIPLIASVAIVGLACAGVVC